MKLIVKIAITIASLLYLNLSLYGIEEITVFTRMNSSVTAYYDMGDYPPELIQEAIDWLDANFSYGYIILDDPSLEYNCFGHAVHVCENGRDEYDVYGREVQLAQSSTEDPYLSDGGYYPIEDPYYGSGSWDELAKVYFKDTNPSGGDYSHTADYGYDTGTYASVYSKCGDYHLIDHYLDDGPYWINCEDISYYSYGNSTGSISDEMIRFEIIQNHPNPFNPTTTIKYSLSNQIQNPQIEIFNTKGQKVRSFQLEDIIGENSIVWNGKDTNNKSVSSGVYFYRLINDGKTVQSRKMLMLK